MIQVFNDIVPDFLEKDDQVLWHGTSNVSESYLDKMLPVPFAWFSQDELEKILSVYNQIGWSGIHPEGFAVLDSFSVCDFTSISNKNIYLGETFLRTIRFASADFAGGELLRSVYYSIRDLITYAKQPEIRNEHFQNITRENEYSFPNRFYENVNISEDLNYLIEILNKAVSVRTKYEHGIIYGYKVFPHDYHKLLYRAGMGILLTDNLDSQTPVYKVILNKEEKYYLFKEDRYRFPRTLVWQKRINSE